MILLTTFGVCLVSAFIPVVNAEAYLVAVTATGDQLPTMLVALAGAGGQMLGKYFWYLGGRYSLRWKWLRKRVESPQRKAQYETWKSRVRERPALSAVMLLVSAFIGLPPLAITSILAGHLRMPWWIFVPVGLIGRLGRFGLIIAGVSLLPWP